MPQLAIDDPPTNVELIELPMRRRTGVAFRRGAGRHPAVAALRTASSYAGAVAT